MAPNCGAPGSPGSGDFVLARLALNSAARVSSTQLVAEDVVKFVKKITPVSARAALTPLPGWVILDGHAVVDSR